MVKHPYSLAKTILSATFASVKLLPRLVRIPLSAFRNNKDPRMRIRCISAADTFLLHFERRGFHVGGAKDGGRQRCDADDEKTMVLKIFVVSRTIKSQNLSRLFCLKRRINHKRNAMEIHSLDYQFIHSTYVSIFLSSSLPTIFSISLKE